MISKHNNSNNSNDIHSSSSSSTTTTTNNNNNPALGRKRKGLGEGVLSPSLEIEMKPRAIVWGPLPGLETKGPRMGSSP